LFLITNIFLYFQAAIAISELKEMSIVLAANLSKKEVIKIFDKNLLADPQLIPLYRDLIGKGQMKPFDCVGTFDESRLAFKIIRSKGEFTDDPVMKTVQEII